MRSVPWLAWLRPRFGGSERSARGTSRHPWVRPRHKILPDGRIFPYAPPAPLSSEAQASAMLTADRPLYRRTQLIRLLSPLSVGLSALPLIRRPSVEERA